ncbi:uncharacterized protein [Drosophila suzukii]|uniref:DUF5641 domain-containing protein n=1 Tax=Drosophila suzukii TaxID=28584 RepID=A0ABM4TYL3_DROSZ
MRVCVNTAQSTSLGRTLGGRCKSARHLFLRAVGEDILTAEELGTLLTSVEAVFNSRPLGAISSVSNDGEALSPRHLPIGGRLLAPPSATLSAKAAQPAWDDGAVSRLSGTGFGSDGPGNVFSLQARNKWHQEVPNVAVGALVVVAEDNLPPQQWMVGRVVAVHVGADSKVRVVDVRTKDGTYLRAIHRLVLLPVVC